MYYALLQTESGRRAKVPLRGATDMKSAEKIAEAAGLQQKEYAALAGPVALDAIVKLGALREVLFKDAIYEWMNAATARGVSERTVSATCDEMQSFATANRLSRVSDTKACHIDVAINAMDGLAVSTKIRKLKYYRSFFKYHHAKRSILIDPSLDVNVKRDGMTQAQLVPVKTAHYSVEEVQKIIAASKSYALFWRYLILFSYQTGLRLSDLSRMERSCIHEKDIRISTGKTKRELSFEITPEMRAILYEAMAPLQPGERYLFPEWKRYSRSIVSITFREIRAKAGISVGTMRSMRKTASQHNYKRTYDQLEEMMKERAIRSSQELLGHTTPATTQRHYLELGNEPKP